MKSIYYKVKLIDDWRPVIEDLTRELENNSRLVVFLKGDLSAGKTTFVSEFCKFHKSSDDIASPTFALQNEYSIELQGRRKTIIHVDLYRLENIDDVESTGFWDLFSVSEALIFIEWSERIPHDLWPLDWAYKQLSIQNHNDNRSVVLSDI